MFSRDSSKKQKEVAEKAINCLKELKALLIKGAEKGEDNTKIITSIEEFVNSSLVPVVTRYLGK